MKKFLTLLISAFVLLLIVAVIVGVITYSNLKPTVETLDVSFNPLDKVQYLDRNGVELSRTYKTKWNVSNQIDLNSVPTLLLNGLIFVGIFFLLKTFNAPFIKIKKKLPKSPSA